MTRTYGVSDFDFDLPPQLIAQHPCPERSASRLLDGRQETPVDRGFKELPQLLRRGDLMIFNDTRVIPARLSGRKATGGSVEMLVERVLADPTQVWAHIRASKSPKPGSTLQLADAFEATVLGRCGPDGGLFHVQFPGNAYALLEGHGHVPLPPYIEHADTPQDRERYQSVLAQHPGAVAAPTASLHFDHGVLDNLQTAGIARAQVTLHVGAGTFQPVRTERLQDHRMHTEWCRVPQATVDAIARTRAAGGRVVAVGTTSLRALESAARQGELQAGDYETDIFITPGFEFQVVDLLLTNFHLPRSTLMMLVSAFSGYEHIRRLYAHAIAGGYRFFSYGDAMLLERKPHAPL